MHFATEIISSKTQHLFIKKEYDKIENKMRSEGFVSKKIDSSLSIEALKVRLKNSYCNSVEIHSKSQDKLRLFIIAGHSGSGKSTFLNTAGYSINDIFCGNMQTTMRPIKSPNYKQIMELDDRMNRHFGHYNRCMTFGSYFDNTHMARIYHEKFLPEEVVLHVDLDGIFTSEETNFMLGLRCWGAGDLIREEDAKTQLEKFFELPVFSKFSSVSALTFSCEYSSVLDRRRHRHKKIIYADPVLKANFMTIKTSWMKKLKSMPLAANYEINSDYSKGYSISPVHQ